MILSSGARLGFFSTLSLPKDLGSAHPTAIARGAQIGDRSTAPHLGVVSPFATTPYFLSNLFPLIQLHVYGFFSKLLMPWAILS